MIVVAVPEHTVEDVAIEVPPTEVGETFTVAVSVVTYKPLLAQVITHI